MARKKIIAGNWKMNMLPQEGEALVKAILDNNTTLTPQTEVVIAPPFIHLSAISALLQHKDGYKLSAQDCHHKVSGAYTGDVSAKMVKSIGADYVIIGHSERREYHGETDSLLAQKVDAALAEGLGVLFCCGEPLDVREADAQNTYVKAQIENSLFHLSTEAFANIVIAYEPIWAIGTGKTASSQQAQDMHAYIRSTIAAKFGTEAANQTSILYGGSCNPKNAEELFSQADIDGGLIGGASLKVEDFLQVISAMK